MKKISLIAAVAENNAIGKDNQMLWHLPDDLKWFKQHTTGCDVIMGKKTFFSLQVHPLPKRKNIVISRNPENVDGCFMASSIEEALEKMDAEKENFVIGGGTIYEQFWPLAQKLYITRVFHNFEADTFFPIIDPQEWKLVSSAPHQADDRHAFSFEFQIFERITP
jgi:dihydrofolate reductase